MGYVKIILLPVGLIVIITLILLKISKFKISIFSINNNYFGHMALDAELRIQEGENKYVIAAFENKNSINSELEKIIEEKIKIYPRFLVLPAIYILEKVHPKISKFIGYIQWGRLREFGQYKYLVNQRKLHLTKQQIQKEDEILKIYGLTKKKYFCVSIRDGEFHKNLTGQKKETYRNMDFKKFENVINNILIKNIGVVRIGRKTIDRTDIKGMVDYVNSEHQSDLADLILIKNSLGLINTGDGVSAVANVLNIPVFYVNHTPWEIFCTFSELNWIYPGLYESNLTGQILTIRELFYGNSPRLDFNEFKKRGYRIKNINMQILEKSIISFCEHYIENHKITNEHQNIMDKFWKCYVNYMPNYCNNIHVKIRSNIPKPFLDEYLDILIK